MRPALGRASKISTASCKIDTNDARWKCQTSIRLVAMAIPDICLVRDLIHFG